MRRAFELSEDQLASLLDACKPVPYMVIGGISPRSPQQNANDAWRRLAHDLGFKWDTVKPVAGKTAHHFTAEAVAPATTEELIREAEGR